MAIWDSARNQLPWEYVLENKTSWILLQNWFIVFIGTANWNEQERIKFSSLLLWWPYKSIGILFFFPLKVHKCDLKSPCLIPVIGGASWAAGAKMGGDYKIQDCTRGCPALPCTWLFITPWLTNILAYFVLFSRLPRILGKALLYELSWSPSH